MTTVRVHTTGRLRAFECECGAKFCLQTWSRDVGGDYHIKHLTDKSEFHCCPFCGGRMSQMERWEIPT